MRCRCLENYSLNPTSLQCEPTPGCHVSCKKCSALNNSSACLECSFSSSILSVNSTCICSDGWYMNTTNTFECLPCSSYCKTCNSTGAQTCTSCPTGLTYMSSVNYPYSTCTNCSDWGFYFDDSSMTCKKCEGLCATCDKHNGYLCTGCLGSANLDSATNTCQCPMEASLMLQVLCQIGNILPYYCASGSSITCSSCMSFASLDVN